MMLLNPFRRLAVHIIGYVVALGYRIWSRSWKRDEEDLALLDTLLADGEGVILVFWHGKFIPLFAMLEGRNTTVFTSDCFRGEVIAHICNRFGFKPSLLPPQGRGNAYRHMVKALKTTKIGAFAIDGPLGPNHQAKSGAIKMASSLGYLIVPVSMACDNKHVMTKRWDDRELPHVSSNVSLAIGDPIRVPSGLRTRDLEEWNVKVTAAINSTDKRAAARNR